MKKSDLTTEIKNLYQSEIMEKLESQVISDLEGSDLSQLKDEAWVSKLLRYSGETPNLKRRKLRLYSETEGYCCLIPKNNHD